MTCEHKNFDLGLKVVYLQGSFTAPCEKKRNIEVIDSTQVPSVAVGFYVNWHSGHCAACII